MSGHGKRLAKLEIRYQRPAEPDNVTPFDLSLLTDDERAELGGISVVMQAIDVGPGPRTKWDDVRARLDVLDDDRLHRLGRLLRKAAGQEGVEAAREWGMSERPMIGQGGAPDGDRHA